MAADFGVTSNPYSLIVCMSRSDEEKDYKLVFLENNGAEQQMSVIEQDLDASCNQIMAADSSLPQNASFYRASEFWKDSVSKKHVSVDSNYTELLRVLLQQEKFDSAFDAYKAIL